MRIHRGVYPHGGRSPSPVCKSRGQSEVL
jgi:hypothetical protein